MESACSIKCLFSVFIFICAMGTVADAADTLPEWTVQSWWDFSTTMDVHIQETGSPEYADFVITDLDTRHHLVSIDTRTLTHGTPPVYDAYILTFTGIVNAAGIYHIEDPFSGDVPMEIRNASLTGEWWVETGTLGTVYSVRHIQGPLWANLLYWQQIGTVDIIINEEYEPARDMIQFPIEVGNAWQPEVTAYSFGEYTVDASIYGQPFFQQGTFDESSTVVFDMTVPLQEIFGGYLCYRIEGSDTGSAGTTLSRYAPDAQTLVYDHMENFGSAGGVQIHSYTRTMGAFYLHPAATPTPQETCVHHGDVNLDGDITAGDAQMAFLIALGIYTPSFEESCAADCNGDGEVTAGDAQAVFLAALGAGTCADPL